MPSATELFDTSEGSDIHLRLMLFGEEKMKKTWWACRAAEAGYNVLLLDIDDGYHIIKRISPEARKNITVLQVADTVGSACGSLFMTLFLKGAPFTWNEETRASVVNVYGTKMPDSYLKIVPAELDKTWVVVIDSWTALSTSLLKRWYEENNQEIEDAERHDRPCYGYASMMATWMNSQIKALSTRTNVITIGHSGIYEKYKEVKKANGKKEQQLEWSKTVIKSTSNPHSISIGRDYSDILYFNQVGKNFFIDTAKIPGRPGGARLIPPNNYGWDELTFAAFCKEAGIEKPENNPSNNPIQVIKSLIQTSEVAVASQTPTIPTKTAGVISFK